MQKAENWLWVALHAGSFLTVMAVCLLFASQSQRLDAQERISETKDSGLQIKDGEILSEQRIWIAGPDGRPLMQYPLEELRELERVHRENSQISGLLESGQIVVELEESSAVLRADFIASISVKNVVKRFDLGLRNCQLVEMPTYETLKVAGNTSDDRQVQPTVPGVPISENAAPTTVDQPPGEGAGQTDPNNKSESKLDSGKVESPIAEQREDDSVVVGTSEETQDETASQETDYASKAPSNSPADKSDGETPLEKRQQPIPAGEAPVNAEEPQIKLPATTSELTANYEQRVIPTNEGYQWLILASQPSTHRLSLKAKTTIDRASDRQGLTIELPLVQTVIRVRLPSNAINERVRSEDLIVTRKLDESGLWLEIRTRGGSFSLTWSQESEKRSIGIVEARSETIYEPFDLLNSSQSWSVTSSLSIRWAAATGSQKVMVRLPRGGQWSNLPFSELERFRITTLPASEAPSLFESTANSQLLNQEPSEENTSGNSIEAAQVTETEVVVANDSSQADVLVIENLDPAALPSVENLSLQWRWLPESDGSNSQTGKFLLQSPELAGTDDHEGSVAVVYPSSYQFAYQELEGTHFIEHSQSLEAGTNRDQVLFGFRNSLGSFEITFRKERSLPTIRPVYRVHVTEDRIELTAWLNCWFDGTASEIAWYPTGWQFDENSAVLLREAALPSTSNVEPLKTQSREDGGYTLSSRQVEPTATKQRVQQVWRLQAHKAWQAEDGSIAEISVPGFDRGVSVGQSRIEFGSGILILSGEPYVVLRQDKSGSKGIWADQAAQEMMPYLRTNTGQPYFYQFSGQGRAPSWAGNIDLLPQRTSLSQRVELAFQENRIAVTQNLVLRVSNRPIDTLKLLARQDAFPLQIMLDDATLLYEIQPSTDAATAPPGTPWREIVVSGLPKRVGEMRLVLQSGIEWQSDVPSNENSVDEVSAKQDTANSTFMNLEVPLVRVPTAEIDGSSAGSWQFQSAPNFDVHSRQSTGSPEASQPIGQSTVPLLAEQHSIPLAIRKRTPGTQPTVRTNGIWLQTLLTSSERRDRLVARIRSDSRQVTVQLPEQAVLERVALGGVALGQDKAPYDYNSNQVAVLLPDEGEHVLEIIYVVSQPLSWAQRLEFSPATLGPNLPLERYYWQLVVPSVYHLGWCPPQLTAEWRWRWKTVWWTRESELDQTGLERWIGAANLSRVPAGTNSYVMSGFEQPSSIDVWILSRFAFWLPSGLAAILIALILSNVRALRSPNFIILIAAAIGCSALLWPEMSILFGQAAFVAMILVVLIWLTQAAVGSRVKRRSIFSAGSASFREISGSGPSLTARSRQSSLSNAPARAATADTTGAE